VHEQTQAVVDERAEAVPTRLAFWMSRLMAWWPVGVAAGGVEGQDLGLPDSHGASKPGQLRDLDAI
jgi:hypothetical protein